MSRLKKILTPEQAKLKSIKDLKDASANPPAIIKTSAPVPVKVPVVLKPEVWPKIVKCWDGITREYKSHKEWCIDARKRYENNKS